MMDIVSKKGSWYSYGDHRLGQGRDKALQYLRENPLLSEEIEKVIAPLSKNFEVFCVLTKFLTATEQN